MELRRVLLSTLDQKLRSSTQKSENWLSSPEKANRRKTFIFNGSNVRHKTAFTAFEGTKRGKSMKAETALGIWVQIVWKMFPLSKVVKAAESPLAESLKAGENQWKEGWKDMHLYDNTDCNYGFSTPWNQGPHQGNLLQCNWWGMWSWPRFVTRESPADTVSDMKVQEEGKTYVHSKRLMPKDQGLQPIPSPIDNFLHIPTSSPPNTPTPSTSLTLPSFIITQRLCRTLQYLLPTAYLASIIRWPGSPCCIVPQMGLELMSLLGFWGKESSMQCVNVNVIMREFVLARHWW